MGVSAGMGEKDFYIGDEAISKRSLYRLSSPMNRGTITDWDSMEKIWDYTFQKQLQVLPEDHPTLLTLNLGQNKEKTAQIMFETFSSPSLHLADRAVMSLFYYGKTSGLVIVPSF